MPVMLALRRLRSEDHGFKASLSYTARFCPKINNKKTPHGLYMWIQMILLSFHHPVLMSLYSGHSTYLLLSHWRYSINQRTIICQNYSKLTVGPDVRSSLGLRYYSALHCLGWCSCQVHYHCRAFPLASPLPKMMSLQVFIRLALCHHSCLRADITPLKKLSLPTQTQLHTFLIP
jgi:hypothetical protein